MRLPSKLQAIRSLGGGGFGQPTRPRPGSDAWEGQAWTTVGTQKVECRVGTFGYLAEPRRIFRQLCPEVLSKPTS